MRLVEFTKLDDRRYVASFEQDGERIEKMVRVGSAAIAVGCDPGVEVRYALVRKAREAVMDFAYLKHGPDEWKKHVRGFWDDPTDEEKQMIERGLWAAKDS